MSEYDNYYYAQYASPSDSEPFYDSNNSEAWAALKKSPTHARYFKFIEDRKHKKELHENWENMIHQSNEEIKEIQEHIKEECDMKVHLKEHKVTFVYEPELSNEENLFKFKVVLRYCKLIGKWYFSLGYSFLPDIIPIKGITKHNVYNPLGPKVLKIIKKIKLMLDSYVASYLYIFKLVDYVKMKYPDISFEVDQYYTNLKILLVEKAWPKSIKKISPVDMLILNLTLNEELEVDNVEFEYIFEDLLISKHKKKIHMDLLYNKIKIFLQEPLYEALMSFMEE